jgi:uncharacterized damage-inducible protein DinB
MDALELLRGLFRHMEWADALVWNAVFSAPAAIDDSVIRQRLHHLHLVQRAFLLIWRGQPMDFKGTESFAPERLATWGHEYHREVAGFLGSLAPASLDTEVHLPWASQVTAAPNASLHNPSLGETLTQVTMHSAYHRGQVNARLREVGAEPPLTDFIAWVWYGKAAATWPSQAQPAGEPGR